MDWIDIRDSVPDYKRAVIFNYYNNDVPDVKKTAIGERICTDEFGEHYKLITENERHVMPHYGKDLYTVEFWMPIPEPKTT